MYRDGLQAARDNYDKTRRRVWENRSHLITPAEYQRLPEPLRKRLEDLESRIEPTEGSVKAIVEAEAALVEYDSVLKEASAALKQHYREKREQAQASRLDRARWRERAAALVNSLRRRKRLWLSLLLITVAALGIAATVYAVKYPSMRRACRRSVFCTRDGSCTPTLPFGDCEPVSNEDCRPSEACEEWGRCTAKDH